MFHLIAENPIRFILALVIGIATAWWIWGRLGRIDGSMNDETSHSHNADLDQAANPPEPEPLPVPAAEPKSVAPVAIASAAVAAASSENSEGKPDIVAAVGDPDDLQKINGIGPKLARLCNSLGVSRFDQIAAWDAIEVAKVDVHLGNFSGRIERDNWVEQAKLLAKGDLATWERRFGYKGKPG